MGYFANKAIEVVEMYNDGMSIEDIAAKTGLTIDEVADLVKFDADSDYDDSMDGDFDSAMASAGFGTDEDYGYYGDE